MRLRHVTKLVFLWSALVICALLRGEDRNMVECGEKYTLILADGQEFDFSSGPGRVAGTGADIVPLEDGGLPPVSHVVSNVFDLPGDILMSLEVGPRTVTLVCSLYGDNRVSLQRVRGALLDAIRWNRGVSDTDGATLRVTVGDDSWDLALVYHGMVTGRQGRHGKNETVAIRFIAHNPTWRSSDESSLVLDWADELNVRLVIAKLDGLWNPLGPPAAVAVGAGAQTIVRAIAVDPLTGNVYIGGDFRNWDNLAAPGLGGDHVVRWNITTETYEVVGNGLDNHVLSLDFGPDGTLYAAGVFLNGSGGAGDPLADYIAQYDRVTDTWINVGGGPGVGAVTDVYDTVIGHDGTLYICGTFTNWAGLGSPAGDYIAQWDAVGGWATVGGGVDNTGYEMAVASNGNLWLVGGFTQTGGAADLHRVGEWDGTAWAEPGGGTNNVVRGVKFGPDGRVYVAGIFTQAGGNAADHIAVWNGASWAALGTGLNAQAVYLEVDGEGNVFVCGTFTQAGPLTIADRVARWNGFSWAHIDCDFPGAAQVRAITIHDNDLYFGFDTQGIAEVAGDNTVTNAGSARTYPSIEIKNAGVLQTIRNETTREEMLFDMQMLDGEIVTIDLRPGYKTITSSWRGNMLGHLLPNSAIGLFGFEGGPRAAYGGLDGANLVSVFITDAAAREHNDGGNQLSGWDDITGVSQANTHLGRLYVSIVFDGGVNYHVDLYSDVARTELVGHTGTYAAPGVEPIIADNASGLGGSLTVDAVVGVDVDIEVIFTVVTMTHFDRWWSLDEAILDAR